MKPDEIKAELAELAKWQVSLNGRDLAEIQRVLVLVLHGTSLILDPPTKGQTVDRRSVARDMIVSALMAHRLLAGLVAKAGQDFPDHLAYKVPPGMAAAVEQAGRDIDGHGSSPN